MQWGEVAQHGIVLELFSVQHFDHGHNFTTHVWNTTSVRSHLFRCKGLEIMAGDRSMESRTGRSMQRYNEAGERLVAGVVPLNAARTHVLLIQSNRRSGWVLPKGGWETDEECTEAAQREAWEEAGIICTIDYDLGQIYDKRPSKKMSKDAPKALYQFYEVTVTAEENEWPEMHKRTRRWLTFAEASRELQSRPELLDALTRSTILR